MRYEAMPLGQLTRRLFEDWRVMVSSDSLASSERVVAFSTLAPMSRRQVLQNLARETGAELRIGYCGTGATFLFGAHPSFTRLRFAPLIGLTNAGAVRDRP